MNHLENTKLALKYWLTVPPQNVADGLSTWNQQPGKHTCGTIACFGGWVPAMPEFAAMGVTANSCGVPRLPGTWIASDVSIALFGEVGDASDVSIALFGEVGDAWDNGKHSDLFDMAGDCSYDRDFCHDFDQFDRSEDHALVVHRLESHIAFLESQT